MGEQVGGRGQERTKVRGHYLLPLDALLVIMSGIDHVSLHARVTTLPELVKGRYQVALTLHHGAIAYCQIATTDGKTVLAGEAAMRALLVIGDIEWSLALSSSPEQKPEGLRHPSVAGSGWSGLVPHRTLATIPLQQLPQRARHVLSLVDSNRNLPQIAHLLHLSIEEVFQILRQAREAGWIDE